MREFVQALRQSVSNQQVVLLTVNTQTKHTTHTPLRSTGPSFSSFKRNHSLLRILINDLSRSLVDKGQMFYLEDINISKKRKIPRLNKLRYNERRILAEYMNHQLVNNVISRGLWKITAESDSYLLRVVCVQKARVINISGDGEANATTSCCELAYFRIPRPVPYFNLTHTRHLFLLCRHEQYNFLLALAPIATW